jgi:hypothetical protein
MKPEDIDDILAHARRDSVPTEAERAAIERAKSALLSDLRPVHPLAPVWVFTLILTVVFAAFALAAGTSLGLHGIRALDPAQRAIIFSTLLVAGWLAAAACARAMRPAAGTRLGVLALALAGGAFPVLFALIFRGYGLQAFVHEGIPCLVAGMAVAAPTGVVIALILRRGFVMDWTNAGTAAGALAGLTGLAMLELHCQNLKAIHVMVWHVAVVATSGALGWITGRICDSIRAAGLRPLGRHSAK